MYFSVIVRKLKSIGRLTLHGTGVTLLVSFKKYMIMHFCYFHHQGIILLLLMLIYIALYTIIRGKLKVLYQKIYI